MTLDEMLQSKDPIIKNAARVLAELNDAVDEKRIKPEEYAELVDDLLDLEKINKLAKSVEHKAELEEAFNMLRSVAVNVISLIIP